MMPSEKTNASLPPELSFEDVANELSPFLGRYLQRVVQDRGIAEDLLQQTLLRIATSKVPESNCVEGTHD